MKKIAIVEDEIIIAHDIKRTLIKFGYNVNGVYTTAESLLNDIEKNIPDLILMDIQLGDGLSGIQTAAIIKEKYNIPVIFVTAYADTETVKKAISNQPFAYILKPFTEETLFTTVNVVFSRVEIEKQLVEAKERFKNLTDLLPLIVFETDTKANFTFLNSYAHSYLSSSEKKNLFDLINEKEELESFLEKIKINKISDSIRFSIKIKNIIPVLIIASPIIKENNFIGFRGVIIDFSEIEKIQNQLIELEKLSTISAVISKFKTELTRYLSESIKLIEEMLKSDLFSEIDLEFIKNNMKNALSITDNLELFEIDKKLNLKQGSLNHLILDISRTLMYTVREKKIKFACNCDHSIQDFKFDAKLIKASIFLVANLLLESLTKEDTFILETKLFSENININIIARLHNPIKKEIKKTTSYQMANSILKLHKTKIIINQQQNSVFVQIPIPIIN